MSFLYKRKDRRQILCLSCTKPKRKYRKKPTHLWVLEVTDCSYRIAWNTNCGVSGRTGFFLELRFLRVMTISEMYFRECHVSGKMVLVHDGTQCLH